MAAGKEVELSPSELTEGQETETQTMEFDLPEVTSAIKEKSRESRLELVEITEELKEEVLKRIEEHADKVKTFLQACTVGGYKSEGGWEAWTREFAEDIGLGDKTFFETRIYVKALQEIIFDELNLKKDKRAKRDGKLGTYTATSLAAYKGWPCGIRAEEMAAEGEKRTGELAREATERDKESLETALYNGFNRILGGKGFTRADFNSLKPDLARYKIDRNKISQDYYMRGLLHSLYRKGRLNSDRYARFFSTSEIERNQKYYKDHQDFFETT